MDKLAFLLMDWAAWIDRDVWHIPPKPNTDDPVAQLTWYFRALPMLLPHDGWRAGRYV